MASTNSVPLSLQVKPWSFTSTLCKFSWAFYRRDPQQTYHDREEPLSSANHKSLEQRPLESTLILSTLTTSHASNTQPGHVASFVGDNRHTELQNNHFSTLQLKLEPLSDIGHQAIWLYNKDVPMLSLTTQSEAESESLSITLKPLGTNGSTEQVKNEDPELNQPSHARKQFQRRLSCLGQFRVRWLSVYRVLIGLTFVVNVIGLALLISFGHPRGAILGVTLFATAINVLASIVVRQEDLLNLSFGLIAKIPSSLPLGFRKFIADFHHYGGVHIGCAVSALMWYVFFVIVNTAQRISNIKDNSVTGWHWADLVTSYSFLLLITTICLTAIPRFRERFHNWFECTHRFGGWASLATLWVNIGVRTGIYKQDDLVSNPSFWLLAASTFFIILPWLRIRRVPIRAQAMASREVRLSFPYPSMPHTSTLRFSLSPLKEWHSFATIPSNNSSTAEIIISAAGDWTKARIANPPTHLWIRSPPVSNFLSVTPIFNSILLVATGAGIGPMLSLLCSPAMAKMKAAGKLVRVIWCVYNPDAPHWAFAQSIIRSVDPVPKIFDSKRGRADLAFETRLLASTCGIEAVMVVSNKNITNEVVRECIAHGGAAYGAVFDS